MIYDLGNQHTVAVAVEAVARADGVAVGGEHEVAAGEGGDEDEERGAREVEVREDRVHGAEAVAGRDGEAGLAATRANLPRLVRGRFERAHRSCADGDDAAPTLAREVDLMGRLRADLEALGLDAVLAQVFDAHGRKRPVADVEREADRLDAARA